MKNIAIFASGQGSNAEAISTHFKSHPSISVKLIVASRAEAPVIQRAERLGIPCVILTKAQMADETMVNAVLDSKGITHIVLAGYLLRIPPYLVQRYARRIFNIHPALLPRHGGKGMYGDRVHQAVLDSHDAESGITIHYVDEAYDSGSIIFQATCPVMPEDTAQTLANRVHQLEYANYPQVVERVILGAADEA